METLRTKTTALLSERSQQHSGGVALRGGILRGSILGGTLLALLFSLHTTTHAADVESEQQEEQQVPTKKELHQKTHLRAPLPTLASLPPHHQVVSAEASQGYHLSQYLHLPTQPARDVLDDAQHHQHR